MKGLIEEKKMVEISGGNTPEISTSNTPKSPDFQGKSSFFSDIALPEIPSVEVSGGNKNLKIKKFRSKNTICPTSAFLNSAFDFSSWMIVPQDFGVGVGSPVYS